MLPIVRTLSKDKVTLELLNTLDPEKVAEYAERSMPWVNDPEINQYLGRQGTTMEKTLEWYRTRPSVIESDRTFAIWVDDMHVGSCGIHSIDNTNGHGCLGILIGHTSLHSQGIGTSAMAALCSHAFNDLKLRKVWLHVAGNNSRGIRCYQKVGFTNVGNKKRHTFRNGILQDEVTMELFAEEYGLAESEIVERSIAHIVKKSTE